MQEELLTYASQEPIAGTVPHAPKGSKHSSAPQLPFKRPQTTSNRDHKALNRGTLGGLGSRGIFLGLEGEPICLLSGLCMYYMIVVYIWALRGSGGAYIPVVGSVYVLCRYLAPLGRMAQKGGIPARAPITTHVMVPYSLYSFSIRTIDRTHTSKSYCQLLRLSIMGRGSGSQVQKKC